MLSFPQIPDSPAQRDGRGRERRVEVEEMDGWREGERREGREAGKKEEKESELDRNGERERKKNIFSSHTILEEGKVLKLRLKNS